jgi:AAA family ATP:ADP antiporter
MLGYRMFKVLGSGLIIVALEWLPSRPGDPQLSWLTFGVCAAWLLAISWLAAEHRRVLVQIKA